MTTLTPSELWSKISDGYQIRMSRKFFRRRAVMTNTVPLISFTFDDFPRSALHTGGAILKSHNLRGTFYTSMALMGRDAPVGKIFSRDDLKALAADGHELGCHTFTHCHSWQTAPKEFEASIINNRCSLHEFLPNASFKTLSYPISCPRPHTKRRMAKHFTCCRGGGQTFNIGTMDLNCLNAFFLEKARDNPLLIKEMIERNARAGGWLIFATHDVSDQPTRFGCTPEFFADVVAQAVQSGARILPVGEACQLAAANHKAFQSAHNSNGQFAKVGGTCV